ncbi:hypothetical protein BDW62DRAFT_179712 [Aspergillus aurantiobrunneus]
MPQKGNTRSRTGCLTCRKRHVRCHEQRPSCQTCLAGKRQCTYLPAMVPLRDRRMLQRNELPPGQQAPWALMNTPGTTGPKLPASTAMDPFYTLPINMPFKSQELYHYFYQAESGFAVAPSDPKHDCVALAMLDEHALRNTILIAGIHYSWNTGNLRAYESAFLFHKLESIRIVNTWLGASGSRTFLVCVKQILTICLTEACLGNLAVAETHLNGTMALFDSRGQVEGACRGIHDIEAELANRYLLLTSCFLLAMKSRKEDFILFRAAQGINPNNEGSSAGYQQLMKLWQGMEYGGLDTKLKALRLFPYLFTPPPLDRQPKIVDALPVIDCLRAITETADRIRTNPTTEHAHQVWNAGGPTKLLMVLVTSHISSFAKEKDDDENRGPSGSGKSCQTPLLLSSWSGISAAAELYMHSVLNILNAGAPLECRLLHHILLILKRDIDKARGDMSGEDGKLCQSLWFWKVFIGVFALMLATSQHRHIVRPFGKCSYACSADLHGLYEWFRNCARAWSAVTGTMDWEDVQFTLATLAWPSALPRDGNDYAANMWAEIRKSSD